MIRFLDVRTGMHKLMPSSFIITLSPLSALKELDEFRGQQGRFYSELMVLEIG